MSRPNTVAVSGTCPQCGTEVQIVMSKKELKMLLKGFKMPIRQAQIQTEKEFERLRRKKK